jgi:hypothetical protein
MSQIPPNSLLKLRDNSQLAPGAGVLRDSWGRNPPAFEARLTISIASACVPGDRAHRPQCSTWCSGWWSPRSALKRRSYGIRGRTAACIRELSATYTVTVRYIGARNAARRQNVRGYRH